MLTSCNEMRLPDTRLTCYSVHGAHLSFGTFPSFLFCVKATPFLDPSLPFFFLPVQELILRSFLSKFVREKLSESLQVQKCLYVQNLTLAEQFCFA